MLFKSTLAAGIVALSAIAVSAPAQAHSPSPGVHGSGGGSIQSGGHGNRHDRGDWRRGHGQRYHLSVWQVRRQLRHRGFHNMYFVDRHAPVYKVRAIGPRGHRVLLVVSSRTGRVINRQPLRRHYPARRRY